MLKGRRKIFNRLGWKIILISLIILQPLVIISAVYTSEVARQIGEAELKSRTLNYVITEPITMSEDEPVEIQASKAITARKKRNEFELNSPISLDISNDHWCKGEELCRKIFEKNYYLTKSADRISESKVHRNKRVIFTRPKSSSAAYDNNDYQSNSNELSIMPEECDFLPDTLDMVCCGSSLTTVPDFADYALHSLIFIETDILTLDHYSVKHLPRTYKLAFYDGSLFKVDFSRLVYELPTLEELNIVKNGLSSFSFFEFSLALGNRNHPLKILDLQYNNIVSLPPSVSNNFTVLRNLLEIYLSHNPLGVLPANFFEPLRASKVKLLHLRNCQLQSIGLLPDLESPLIHLPNLVELDLTYNPQMTRTTLGVLLSPFRNGSLRALFLNMNSYDRVPKLALKHASHSLEILELDSSSFSCIDRLSFPSMPALKNLTMRSSRISEILEGAFDNLPNLKDLYLDNNLLTFIPPALKLPQLVVLSLTNNPSNLMSVDFEFQMRSFAFILMEDLQYLSLSKNNLNHIRKNAFYGLESLVYLDLSFCSIGSIDNYSFAGLDNLEYLLLGNNLLENLAEYTFDGLAKLIYLDLSQNKLGTYQLSIANVIKNLNVDSSLFQKEIKANLTVFHSLHRLQYLHLNDNYIDMSSYLFDGLYSLKKLFLSNNAVSSWKLSMLTQNPFLEFLGLSQNFITTITDAMADDFQKEGLVVDLSFNTFICSCDFYDYKYTLNETFFLNNLTYQCTDENKTWFLWRYLKVYSESDCNKEAQVTTLPENGGSSGDNHSAIVKGMLALLASCMVLFLIGVTTYKNRWYFKYLTFKVRSKVMVFSLDKNADYDYDTFICYAQKDRQWVFETLVRKLESSKSGFRVCVHERDFLAGEAVASNIINSIERSRKVLVILSRSFVDSSWCMFELELAASKILSERKNKLIIIILEDFNIKDQPRSLRTILKRRTYIRWFPDIEGQKLFFARLFRAIAKPNVCEELRTSEVETSPRISISYDAELDYPQLPRLDSPNHTTVEAQDHFFRGKNSASSKRQSINNGSLPLNNFTNREGIAYDFAEASNRAEFGWYENYLATIQMTADEPVD